MLNYFIYKYNYSDLCYFKDFYNWHHDYSAIQGISKVMGNKKNSTSFHHFSELIYVAVKQKENC